jgi:hypothetical protein
MKWLFSSIFGLIGLIFLVLGCPMLAGAAGLYYYLDTATQDWVKVTGTVTALNESSSYDDDTGSYMTTSCPTIAYTTASGETIENDVNECASPPQYQVGDSVELYYDPQDVRNVQIEGGVRDLVGNIFVIVFGILGAVFSLIGGGLAVFAIVAALWRNKTPASV